MHYRILLIDDSIIPESNTFLALQAVGQVIRARTVLEATAQCDKLHPDIVVADCPVDGLNAAAIYARLKDNGCTAPVVALVHGTSDDATGAVVILRKLLSDAELQAAVRDLLASVRPTDRP